jgi:hypothetical protein
MVDGDHLVIAPKSEAAAVRCLGVLGIRARDFSVAFHEFGFVG